MIKDITVEAVSKYGVMVEGSWINTAQGFDLTKFRKGQSYKVNTTVDRKGKTIISAIVGSDAANTPTAAQVEAAKTEAPKPAAKSNKATDQYGRELSDYALEKDKRIGLQGIIQSIIISPLTPAFVLKPEDLAPYVEARTREILDVMQKLVKEA